MKKYFLLIVCLATIYSQTLEDDLVEDFPDWPSSYKQKFNVYSGYLDIGHHGNLHYIFVEKQQNSDHSPLLVWFNGGPGCSSMEGFLQEIGPYILNPASFFNNNNNSWNHLANLLFIEGPGEVGFSKQTDDQKAVYKYNDMNSGKDFLEGIKQFMFVKSTRFSDSDVYLAGEAFGGSYITMVTIQLLLYNTGVDLDEQIKLKHVILGNPIIDERQQAQQYTHLYNLQYLEQHGFYSQEMNKLFQKCGEEYEDSSLNTPKCKYFDDRNIQIKIQLNPYNIHDYCQNQVSIPDQFNFDENEITYCKSQTALEEFFNSRENRIKLNVSKSDDDDDDDDDDDILQIPWQACNAAIQGEYTPFSQGAISQLIELIKLDIKVSFYSGLLDAVVPFQVIEEYIQEIIEGAELSEKKDISQFVTTEDRQVAGWYTTYGTNSELSFLKLKASGHEAAKDSKIALYQLLSDFINGKDI